MESFPLLLPLFFHSVAFASPILMNISKWEYIIVGTRIITWDILACILPTYSDNRRMPFLWNTSVLGHAALTTFCIQCENLHWRILAPQGPGLSTVWLAEAVQVQRLHCLSNSAHPKYLQQAVSNHGRILLTETQKDTVHGADAFHQSTYWPAESLCFCTLILSRRVMTIIWSRLVLPIQLCQKIWVSFWSATSVNIFTDIKWATECVSLLEKTPVLGCILRFGYSEIL